MGSERRRMHTSFAVVSFVFFFFAYAEASLYVTDIQMNKMIELTIRKPYCQIHTDRGSIQHVVLSMDSLKVRQVPLETINTLEKVCLEGNQLRNEIQGGLSFIYPGTLWCGPGNIAKNFSDLGRHAEEDKCCRSHDNCYPQISPGECLKSICNKGSFTRLHCDCDEKFRRCLSTLNTDIGNTLGAAFFNAVQVTCFDYRRPCSSHQRPQDCDYEFFTERPFQFRQTLIHDHSENLITAEARSFHLPQPQPLQQQRQQQTSFNRGAGGGFLDGYSLQLFLNAIYDNFIYRPIRTFTNFFLVTKTIIIAPTTKIEENFLIP